MNDKKYLLKVSTLLIAFFISISSAPAVFAAEPSGAMVTFAFDDGWKDQYTEAMPLLSEHGFHATYYVTSDVLEPGKYTGFMSQDDVRKLHASGNEIGSHTVNHVDLTAQSDEAMAKEISDSKSYLEDVVGAPVKSIAYPYGKYDQKVIAAVEEAGYESARSTDDGLNAQDSNHYALASLVPTINTPVEEVESAIDKAMESGNWLIITFHEINSQGREYSATKDFLAQILDYVAKKGVKVVTISQGLASEPEPAQANYEENNDKESEPVEKQPEAKDEENHDRPAFEFHSRILPSFSL